ncbi:SAM-dependent methyltransferase [Actinoplanes sp. TBRC 11911]|uniref:SAM-dependent methyltransferase n=1 Tax=Actinoplanes sp. TBRC 11911 TaxID=2729386 RepID=UPI00145D061B|nr:SAM-dependent methyltransferase [Actinoplanes sp. TBRC 11911]NMO49919.1 SAM-dependent methyltransferase [Actinoplanes sp. TBRC 11911]
MDDAKRGIDTSVPHPARRYNYWLGGKDNFAADRESGDEFARRFPGVRIGVRANRAFLQRTVRFLAAERGIRQFLDIGTGLPTADNTHEVAQRVAPESRVVYVDNDPLVMTHARALLDSTPQGRTAYLEADLRNPGDILREAAETLDFGRPIAVLLVAVLHFIPGTGAARPLVRELLDAMPSGSYLSATHGTLEFSPPEYRKAHEELRAAGRSDAWLRGSDEFGAVFDGLELEEPGLVPVTEWRPDTDGPLPDRKDVAIIGAVGKKP